MVLIKESVHMATGSTSRPKVSAIPAGFHSVTPYLVVSHADQVLQFVKRAFGAHEVMAHRGPDGSVMHAEARIGDSIVMMGSGGPGAKPRPGSIYVYVPDVNSTYKAALGAGAKSVQEPKDQPYGDRNACVEDSAGNHWFIATHIEDVSTEELNRRMAAQKN